METTFQGADMDEVIKMLGEMERYYLRLTIFWTAAGIVWTIGSVWVLYWVIRVGVRDGIRDAAPRKAERGHITQVTGPDMRAD